MAAYVLAVTDEGKELVDALLAIAHGELPGKDGVRPRKGQVVRPAEQLKAIELLMERGWGRAFAQAGINMSVSGQVNHAHLLANWTDEELETLSGMRALLLPQGLGAPVVEGELASVDEVGNSRGAL